MNKKVKTYDVLPIIPYGKRPKVLLVGNGINLSFSDSKDVDGIIQQAWKNQYRTDLPARNDSLCHHSIWEQPLPMQVVIATKDHVGTCMKGLAQEFKASKVDLRQKEMIEKILLARFDAVLTTNYSLEIERSIMPGATDRKIQLQYKTTQKQTYQQSQLGIFQGTELPYANHPILWHIHGTSFRNASLVMGQFLYGKLLSEVVQRANIVSKNYNKANKDGVGYIPKSWIDYFLIGDVYCFGFSLSLSESDIWWLLSLKKSAFKESSFNLFERVQSNGVNSLLYDAYGINRPNVSNLIGNNYIEFYEKICETLYEE